MERVIELVVEQAGLRVDQYVAQQVNDLSRSYVQKLLAVGRITVDGEVPKASYRVEEGQRVVLRVPPPEPIEAAAESIPLTIVHEDERIIVVDKPAGMVVHPAYGHRSGTLVNAVLAHCPDLAGIGGDLRPGIVHRLDKDTSGLIVVAKDDAAHQHLQRQFKERTVDKMYLALTEGRLTAPRGIIDAPIGRDPKQRKRMAVVRSGGRESRTEFTIREAFPEHTLVEARPLTGRTHQIRIHFASIGHPLVGDPVYGYRRQRLPLERQFLHAARLAFALPGTGERAEFHSDLPEDLEAVLESLRRQRG